MIKRFFYAVLILVFVTIGWYAQALRPVTNQESPLVEFEVKTGQDIDKIGENLSQLKLIRSRTAFKITVVRLGISSKIQAGFFRLSPNMDITEIAQKLTKAMSKQVRVTIQEGVRVQEIASIIDKSFKEKSSESNFNADEFVTKTKSIEGQLFPDTYDFDPKANTDTVINRLKDRHAQVVEELKIPTEKLHKTIIIASLLEREAANSDEMPEVAGVLENRLKAGWPLQIDATVQYAISTIRCKKLDCDWWPNNLTRADIDTKSPFNTYLNQGLPPSPISNPGKDSLSAALNPSSNNYWFYLHDNQGKIHFAQTIEEHNQNICVYLKKDCN